MRQARLNETEAGGVEGSEFPATRHAGERAMNALSRAWRWGNKWLVHIWLGIPLMFGLVGWIGGGLDQYQDLGEYAAKAPRIEKYGLIKKTDLRGRWHVLIDGEEKISITCSFPPHSECIRYIAPLKAKIKYFQYRNNNVIIDLISDDGRHLIKENEEVKSWMKAMKSYRESTTSDSILWMIFFSFYLVIPLMIGIPIIRWIGRRNAVNKGKL